MTNFLSLQIDDSKALSVLNKISLHLNNLNHDLEEIESIVDINIQSNLTNSKNYNGGTYDPLKKSYISSSAFKRRRRYSMKPLDTENYRNKMFSEINNNTINFGSNHPGIITHEKGLSVNIFGRGVSYKFPQRSAIWVSKSTIERISKNLVASFVKDAN